MKDVQITLNNGTSVKGVEFDKNDYKKNAENI